MKKSVTIILAVLFFFLTIYANNVLDFFNGFAQGNVVRLEWGIKDQSNLKHFILERKPQQSNSPYQNINTIPKENDLFYEYYDDTAYKGNDLLFIYRLKIVDNNNNYIHSDEIVVSSRPNEIKRTWGSIKAMFR